MKLSLHGLPNGADNAQCCCQRDNMSKETYSLDSHDKHMWLVLSTMQAPAWRTAHCMAPKPLMPAAGFWQELSFPVMA
jgi:hypothetical protein